jgi:hypothetical protein
MMGVGGRKRFWLCTGGSIALMVVLVVAAGDANAWSNNAHRTGARGRQGAGQSPTSAGPIVPPPTLPAGQGARGGNAHHVIPEGFLPEEERARLPLSQPDVYWVRNDGADLPPILTPCRGRPARDNRRIDGRQLVLVGPSLWKASRLTVYRDVRAAKAAMSEIRTALRRCKRQDRTNGETTVWTSQALPIGDEAVFVGGEEFRGTERVPGIFRGVVMRSGRAVQVYLVCGQATETPTPPADLAGDATTAMAQRLAQARWAQSP